MCEICWIWNILQKIREINVLVSCDILSRKFFSNSVILTVLCVKWGNWQVHFCEIGQPWNWFCLKLLEGSEVWDMNLVYFWIFIGLEVSEMTMYQYLSKWFHVKSKLQKNSQVWTTGSVSSRWIISYAYYEYFGIDNHQRLRFKIIFREGHLIN